MFDSIDYQLRWPRAMFQREATALLELPLADNRDWWVRAEQLLDEAFAGQRATDDLRATKPRPGPGAHRDLMAEELPTRAGRTYLAKLVAASDQLREPQPPRPYWRARSAGEARQAPQTDIREQFAALIGELDAADYFEKQWPRPCDKFDEEGRDPNTDLDQQLGVSGLWPLINSWSSWDTDLFYELIEVLHDAVARPRYRIDHQYICAHGLDFSVEAGRVWYRYRVNQLLGGHDVGYRLADDGEDVGRLIAITDEARAELAANMAARTDSTTGDEVRHALALFRARGATRQDKRSAIVALAGVVEERRALLKAELFSKDEGALFQIANNFGLRHQQASQQDDYDPMFLDWVFWWYLATIEFTDRLLVRQAGRT